VTDDELERLRALFKHAHDQEKKSAFRKALLRIKRRLGASMTRPKPKPGKKDEAA
jgi:hypothetical protein